MPGFHRKHRLRRLKARAQSDYERIRACRPGACAWHASPRLVVLPDRMMCRLGGAAVVYRWTCVCPALLRAPRRVRRAILAHEWGHVVRGHSLATCASLVLVAAFIVSFALTSAEAVLQPLANLLILAVAAGMSWWALHPGREYEADDVALSIVHADELWDGLAWACLRFRDGRVPVSLEARLGRLAEASRREPS